MGARTTFVTDRKCSALVLLPVLFLAVSVNALIPPSTSTFPTGTAARTTSHLNAAAPLGDLPPLDPQELSSHAQALHGILQHQTSLLLSQVDASVTLENFEETQAALLADEGWWAAYLNIFKTTIEVIHNGIDGPFHSIGWTGGTWGFSIALFTAGVRTLLIPLSFQQTKSTEMTKALKPYIDLVNEKFKDNDNRKNQLVGKLYEDANQNPLSGCFLSLLQLPLILGLYRGVRLLALDGKLDEPFLWIPSLEGPVSAETDYRGLDWLTQGWAQIDGLWTPSLGWPTTLAYCVLPVVLVLGQKLTMEALQPPEDDTSSMDEDAKDQLENTKKVLKFLPLLIGFFSLQVPAGLTIYWFVSNFFTLATALTVRKYYEQNPPEIELPEYWDSLGEDENQMSVEDRRKAVKAGVAKGPSIADWIESASFHTLVERDGEFLNGLNSESWKEANIGGKLVIPAEFQMWVDTPDTPVEHETPHGDAGASEAAEAKKEETVTA